METTTYQEIQGLARMTVGELREKYLDVFGGDTRCAIYTRKSTDEGLEQEFNSLDAQRESAEAYIASQRHEGWSCLPARYDDGGFTGGNMERPALQLFIRSMSTESRGTSKTKRFKAVPPLRTSFPLRNG
jgi:hypothetical protein